MNILTDKEIARLRELQTSREAISILEKAKRVEVAQAAPAAPKEPCIHKDVPSSCYRVRCQLGSKCVDDDMSFRAAPAAQKAIAAEKTLEHLGYTYHGAEYWKPPLGTAKAAPVAQKEKP